MSNNETAVDPKAMDEFQWRAWLRSVTPFIDGESVREHFPQFFTEFGDDYLMSNEPMGPSGELFAYMFTKEMENEFNFFSLHRYEQDGAGTASFYAVHTHVENYSTGRTLKISYWPHTSAVLDRLGIDSVTTFIENAFDGHQNKHLRHNSLTIPAQTVLPPSLNLFPKIQHEINAAWFHEPTDLERVALREESEKANPAPTESGRASTRL